VTRRVFILLVVLMVAASCNVFTPKVHIVVRNGTASEINNAMLTFAGRDIPIGDLLSGTHASYGPIVTDIPPEATLSWQTADGRQHTQRIDVKSRIRENRSGDVVFTIVDADRVEVLFQRLDN